MLVDLSIDINTSIYLRENKFNIKLYNYNINEYKYIIF